VKGAGVEDLVRVRGIGRRLAETIYNELPAHCKRPSWGRSSGTARSGSRPPWQVPRA
jgi:hypothetical protein